MAISLTNYDLNVEAQKVRDQISSLPQSPIVDARNLMSQAILAHTLLALSDAGFYEWIAERQEFTMDQARKDLKLNQAVSTALFEYLLGAQIFESDDKVNMRLTERGKVLFNVYTRGVMNIYLGGYMPFFSGLSGMLVSENERIVHEISRSTHHAAAGTAFATCVFTIPEVYKVIDEYKPLGVMDLGCGTGDFLINYLRRNPKANGVGVDMSEDAIAQAKFNAEKLGLSDRLKFFVAEIGKDEIAIPKEEIDKFDVITSMYMVHEFGRDGDEKVIDVLSKISAQFPDKYFLMLEVEECDPYEFSKGKSPAHIGRLDYRVIHQLSGQGLPKLPSDWHEIFAKAGFDVVEKGIKTGGSYVYVGKAIAAEKRKRDVA